MMRHATIAIAFCAAMGVLAATPAAAQPKPKVVGGVLGGAGSVAAPTREAYAACRRSGWSCLEIGYWLERHGRDGAPYHERACDAGRLHGCYEAGEAYRRQGPRMAPRPRRALTRGCDGGDQMSCMSLAELIAASKTPRAREKARAVIRRACRREYWRGCEVVGVTAPRRGKD